jgi:hypothetical protein
MAHGRSIAGADGREDGASEWQSHFLNAVHMWRDCMDFVGSRLLVRLNKKSQTQEAHFVKRRRRAPRR